MEMREWSQQYWNSQTLNHDINSSGGDNDGLEHTASVNFGAYSVIPPLSKMITSSPFMVRGHWYLLSTHYIFYLCAFGFASCVYM